MNDAGLAAVRFLADHERSLWIGALLLYGVGDTITTFWGLSTSGVAEAGPIAGPLIESYGRESLLGIKVVVFGLFYAVWSRLRTAGRVAVPLALAVVGGFVTVWNVVVILSAS
ncbi:hypothetical protein OB955_01960 [Halobacteria archaeon AArc-m2/3/4]|uniref:DUF5658 domain-containing protein n=1 Tax=Natronoglomus mannanivorans TaxID=2979990 RepID=A0AAP2YWP8_9EURY|nr:hypothetical protein [Halobacteria archaeon AArc-xg1-1]MCU4971507.1 hypothetical protein [Halobacteria archaeon AArc-m2/3/4]